MMTYEERLNILINATKKDGITDANASLIFSIICDCATDYHEGSNVISSNNLANLSGLSRYKVMKAINILRDIFLVERTTCGFPAYEIYTESGLVDFDCSHPPKNGFGLSLNGYKSNTYKKAEELLDLSYREWASGGT